MSEIIFAVLGAAVALLAVFLGKKGKAKRLTRNPVKSEEEYQETKQEVVNELEKKPAADIVSDLDNSGDISAIKKESDGGFDNILDRHRKDLDR